jgi:hypothetical protein
VRAAVLAEQRKPVPVAQREKGQYDDADDAMQAGSYERGMTGRGSFEYSICCTRIGRLCFTNGFLLKILRRNFAKIFNHLFFCYFYRAH